MSGASEAVKALQATASNAYRATHIAGSHYARANQGVAEADDIVKALSCTIDLLVAAEQLHASADAAVKMLREVLSATMNDTGATTVQATHHSAHLARKPAVLTVDETQLPAEFIVQRPTVDRAAIKEAIKAGTEVPGASMLVPNQMSLVLRARKEPTQ